MISASLYVRILLMHESLNQTGAQVERKLAVPTKIARLYVPEREFWDANTRSEAYDLNFFLETAFCIKGLELLNIERYPQDPPPDLGARFSMTGQDAIDASQLYQLHYPLATMRCPERSRRKEEIVQLHKKIYARYPSLKEREVLVEIQPLTPENMREVSHNIHGALHDEVNFFKALYSWHEYVTEESVLRDTEKALAIYARLVDRLAENKLLLEGLDARMAGEMHATRIPLTQIYHSITGTLEDELKREFAPSATYQAGSYQKFLDLHCDFQDFDVPENVETNYSRYWAWALAGNLAQNAVRSFQRRDITQPHRARDPKIVSVTYEYMPKRREIKIFVIDNGTGFDEEILRNGFTRGRTTDPEKGSGVGMADQVKALESMGIKVKIKNIYSEEGEPCGAMQTFVFPIAQ